MADSNTEKNKLFNSMLVPTIFIIVICLVKLLEIVLETKFGFLGNRPRNLAGINGIFTMPFVHGDIKHLFNNSTSFFVLGTALYYFYRRVANKVLLITWLFSGVFVWLLARGSNHIGASGIVYGLAAFLFTSGVLRKDRPAMVIALVVTFFYGSMVWGLIPGRPGISWEGHLFGALGGVFAAFLYRYIDLPVNTPSWQNEGTIDKPNDYWKDFVNDAE